MVRISFSRLLWTRIAARSRLNQFSVVNVDSLSPRNFVLVCCGNLKLQFTAVGVSVVRSDGCHPYSDSPSKSPLIFLLLLYSYPGGEFRLFLGHSLVAILPCMMNFGSDFHFDACSVVGWAAPYCVKVDSTAVCILSAKALHF